jgi:hypothetical protein
MKDGFVGYWKDQDWIEFYYAANLVGDKLAIPPGAAKTQLCKLCASGQIKGIASWDPEDEPEPIPAEWWRNKRYTASWDWVVAVSGPDLRNWLKHQSATPTAGGKQSRIARLLAEMYPTGVPNRGDCPRWPLRATLLKRDASLKPLDLKTLKTAIDAFNRQLGNARNTSVSD